MNLCKFFKTDQTYGYQFLQRRYTRSDDSLSGGWNSQFSCPSSESRVLDGGRNECSCLLWFDGGLAAIDRCSATRGCQYARRWRHSRGCWNWRTESKNSRITCCSCCTGRCKGIDADSPCSFQRDFTRCTEKSLRGYSRGSWRTTFHHLQQPLLWLRDQG